MILRYKIIKNAPPKNTTFMVFSIHQKPSTFAFVMQVKLKFQKDYEKFIPNAFIL